MKKATKRAKKVALPPIPATAFTVHGAVPVKMTDDPTILDPGDFGCWNAHDRIIYIRCGMSPTSMWLTLFHEITHADLSDIDFAIEHDALEAICNAIASARFAALRAGVTLP